VIKQIPAGLRILHSEIWWEKSLQIGPKFSVVVKLMWHCQLSRNYFPLTVLYLAGYSLASFSTHMWRAKTQLMIPGVQMMQNVNNTNERSKSAFL